MFYTCQIILVVSLVKHFDNRTSSRHSAYSAVGNLIWLGVSLIECGCIRSSATWEVKARGFHRDRHAFAIELHNLHVNCVVVMVVALLVPKIMHFWCLIYSCTRCCDLVPDKHSNSCYVNICVCLKYWQFESLKSRWIGRLLDDERKWSQLRVHTNTGALLVCIFCC